MAVGRCSTRWGRSTRHQARHVGMYIFLASEGDVLRKPVRDLLLSIWVHIVWRAAAIEHAEFYVNWWPSRRSTPSAVLQCFHLSFRSDALAHGTAGASFTLWMPRFFLGWIEFGQLYEFIAAFARGMTLTANSFASTSL